MGKTGCIYKILNNQSGKIYIGQTIQPIKARLSKHLRDAFNTNNREYTTKFNKAIRKYGQDAWNIEVLENNIPADELNILERYYIELLDTYKNGYNSTLGGGGTYGYSHTTKTKNKISISSKKRTHTQETRNKISAKNKNKYISADTRIRIGRSSKGRISSRFLGYTHSEKSKQKISKAHQGKIISNQALSKKSETSTGISRNGTSKYVGVSWRKHIGKWAAKFQGRYLGVFESEKDAAVAYNDAALSKYGANAKVNIIE